MPNKPAAKGSPEALVNVYPVYNGPKVQFIPGVPAVPRLGITTAEAKELIGTGAFTYDEPPPEAIEREQLKAPVDPGPSDSAPEGE